MIIYSLKSMLCLALLFGVYKLFLEREKMFVFNRFFLLLGLPFALIIPWVGVGSSFALIPQTRVAEVIPRWGSTEALLGAPSPANWNFSWNDWLLLLYLSVVAALALRFTYRIWQLLKTARKHEQAPLEQAKLVLLPENEVPFTFLNRIYINQNQYAHGTIEKALLTHELTHVQQKHSWDILLIEFVQLWWWFNPLLKAYKKAIQLNHEFLADDQVLRERMGVSAYQELLLAKIKSNGTAALTSSINFSITKKRLQMMTKTTTRMRALLQAALTVPFLVACLFLFGSNAKAQDSNRRAWTPEMEKAMTNYFKDAYFGFDDQKNRFKPFSALTDAEKLRLPPPPPHPEGKPLKPLPKGAAVFVSKDGKVRVDRTGNELPPPPPPPRPAKQEASTEELPIIYEQEAEVQTGESTSRTIYTLEEIREQENLLPPPPPPPRKPKS